MASQYSTQSSNLRSEPPPRSYGAVPSYSATPSNGPSDNPPSYSPYSTAPGPAFARPPEHMPHPTPSQNQTPAAVSPRLTGPLTFFVVSLVMIGLIVADTVVIAKFVNLKYMALLESRERSALVAERMRWKDMMVEWEYEREKSESEREKLEWEREESEREREESEREREKMRRERELWEKERKDRVPPGAFWEVVWPAWDCRAYGKREYWGLLRNIPQGQDSMDACMNMPIEIEGVTINRPYRCAFVGGDIHGYWMVDWDQTDCKPWFRDFRDEGCTNYGSGARRIEAELVGINGKGGQDWWVLCTSTPLVWGHVTYKRPTHCEEQGGGRKVAMWDMPDKSCD